MRQPDGSLESGVWGNTSSLQLHHPPLQGRASPALIPASPSPSKRTDPFLGWPGCVGGAQSSLCCTRSILTIETGPGHSALRHSPPSHSFTALCPQLLPRQHQSASDWFLWDPGLLPHDINCRSFHQQSGCVGLIKSTRRCWVSPEPQNLTKTPRAQAGTSPGTEPWQGAGQGPAGKEGGAEFPELFQ